MKSLLRIALLLIMLLQMTFTQGAFGQSFRDVQVATKDLGRSYDGVWRGVETFGKGVWGIVSNTGKLLWYGTHKGYARSKKADQWVRKKFW